MMCFPPSFSDIQHFHFFGVCCRCSILRLNPGTNSQIEVQSSSQTHILHAWLRRWKTRSMAFSLYVILWGWISTYYHILVNFQIHKSQLFECTIRVRVDFCPGDPRPPGRAIAGREWSYYPELQPSGQIPFRNPRGAFSSVDLHRLGPWTAPRRFHPQKENDA